MQKLNPKGKGMARMKSAVFLVIDLIPKSLLHGAYLYPHPLCEPLSPSENPVLQVFTP
jgi:hypothetical protein